MDAAEKILAKISDEECAELALALGKIYSPWGQEGEAADYVYRWLLEHGFEAVKIGATPDRPNVMGRLRGAGGGPSLIFNAHMDHAHRRDSNWQLRNPGHPIHSSAWRENDRLYGNGLVNDKGPLAATMIAAAAVRESGVKLRGDLLVSGVVGEIDIEPVDEFEAPTYLSHDVGAQYLLTHGGVADYCLNAEASTFSIVQMEAGLAFFKITVYAGPNLYVPFIPRPTPVNRSPNAIVRSAALVLAIEEWALQYQQRHRYQSARGECVPKVNIGAQRSGYPYRTISTPEVSGLYLCITMPPGMLPGVVEQELRGVVAGLDLEAAVELTSWRPGKEVGDAAEPLIDAIKAAHRAVRGGVPAEPQVPHSSMWRDMNVYNLYGIPSVCYGAGISVGSGSTLPSMVVSELADSARAYALTAMHLSGVAGSVSA